MGSGFIWVSRKIRIQESGYRQARLVLKREKRNENISYFESGEASLLDLRFFPEVVNPKFGNFTNIFVVENMGLDPD
jgi:hypothetical protein